MEVVAENRIFEGRQLQCTHHSEVLSCDMTFSVFLPPQAPSGPVPCLYWLSGLTCTDQNFVTKAGAQSHAARLGMAIVCPDTSPRGEGVPDDPEGAYDFGLGAGFYVNATQAPWSANYRMFDYVTTELPQLIEREFPVNPERVSVSGHSMGGHGALVAALRSPGRYRSVSAFSPICAPTRCPWGEKALGNYLGDDRESWQQYDATALITAGATGVPTLVDQGDADEFLEEQLQLQLLIDAAEASNYPLEFRMQAGYDHSYFFIATFIGDHLEFHARALEG